MCVEGGRGEGEGLGDLLRLEKLCEMVWEWHAEKGQAFAQAEKGHDKVRYHIV